MAAKKKSKTTQSPIYAIIANSSYGLFAGLVESFDPATQVAIVKECRHVRYWYGKTGGITSLAAHGLCGPRAAESRIGAPCAATLTHVINIFECSPEARATIEAAKQS